MGLQAQPCEVVGGCDPYTNTHTHTNTYAQQDQSIDECLTFPRGDI